MSSLKKTYIALTFITIFMFSFSYMLVPLYDIFCEITGYGNSKLAHSKKAYDFLIQAESGLCSVTGTEKYPAKVGISITDLSSGLTAYSAIFFFRFILIF